MLGPDELAQLHGVFTAEGGEILTRMEQHVVELERAPSDSELLNSLFRGAHTLKGNAASLGFQAMADLAHGLEEVLDQLRSGAVVVSAALTTLLLGGIDAIRELFASGGGPQKLSVPHRKLQRQLLSRARGDRRRKAPAEESVAASLEALVPAADAQAAPLASRLSPTLRVEVGTLDTLMNLAGEITSSRERLARACHKLGPAAAEALEVLRDSERLYVDLHEAIVRTRLVPLGPTFRQQIRTLRDAAARSGKRAELTLSGEDVMVDTSLVDNIRESLVHIIRNALDHGIEAPDARSRAGKPASGTIALRATRRGGNIVIQVVDDGGGLDRAAILARAKRRALVPADADLPAAEIDRLLFLPGFTTNEAVTELSGRGVGLDVVRRRIEALRGSVHIESAPGAGSTVTLRVPLTVAIIEAYHVVAGGHRYVVPADVILECRQLEGGVEPHARSFADREGSALAWVRLASALGVHGPPPPREELLVVACDGVPLGLAVDKILGSAPTVVKPLGAAFNDLDGLAGFTILGSGDVVPILDVAGILARHRDAAAAAAS